MKTLLTSLMFVSLAVAPETNQPQAETEKPPTPKIMIGKVTGDQVNVRSGPSTNYYLVTRLNKEDRVVIYENKHGWLGIQPPAGCFSLVAKQYVDLDVDKKTGVINVDHVWVHAGSDLSKQTYAKQPPTMNRGQLVEILGELDQFYKITPPHKRMLWMSAEYVQFIEDNVTPGAVDDMITKAEAAAQAIPPLPSGEKAKSDHFQIVIEQTESDLEQEFMKDIMERDLQCFIERFQKIADQDADREAQQYAAYRVVQLTKLSDNVKALIEMRALATRLQGERQRYMKARANIHPRSLQVTRDFDVRGKFVKSFAYDSPTGLRRYRLLDPDSKTNRTIAYVEIEQDSNIDPEAFVGRVVGVRSKGQRLVAGTVDPIKVYTAAEIVVLEQPPADTEGGEQK